MKVSAILATYNNSKMLESTLFAFEKLEIPRDVEFEVVVINNNSTDNTYEVVSRFSDRLPINYAFEKKQGIAAAKNKGIQIAHGELLIFTDDDVRPSPLWVKSYFSAYQMNPTSFFWGGPIISEFEGPVPNPDLLRVAPASVKGFDLGTAQRTLAEGEWFIGPNWACPASALADIGTFNESKGLNPAAGVVLVAEETDLMERLKVAGYTGLYLPTASLRHVVPIGKCSVRHIGARAEAWGRHLGGTAPANPEQRTLHGVPLWRYRRCAECWSKAWLKRIAGSEWYPDYMEYRVAKGVIRGLAERRVSRAR